MLPEKDKIWSRMGSPIQIVQGVQFEFFPSSNWKNSKKAPKMQNFVIPRLWCWKKAFSVVVFFWKNPKKKNEPPSFWSSKLLKLLKPEHKESCMKWSKSTPQLKPLRCMAPGLSVIKKIQNKRTQKKNAVREQSKVLAGRDKLTASINAFSSSSRWLSFLSSSSCNPRSCFWERDPSFEDTACSIQRQMGAGGSQEGHPLRK